MLWASCRYLQFTKIQRLPGSVNFGPGRQTTEKVSKLGQNFGYPTDVRRLESVPGVRICIGKPEPYFFLII